MGALASIMKLIDAFETIKADKG